MKREVEKSVKETNQKKDKTNHGKPKSQNIR